MWLSRLRVDVILTNNAGTEDRPWDHSDLYFYAPVKVNDGVVLDRVRYPSSSGRWDEEDDTVRLNISLPPVITPNRANDVVTLTMMFGIMTRCRRMIMCFGGLGG